MLQAGRTLLEKLAVLHTRLGSDATADDRAKYGRHYLDIYQLLADARVLSMLDNRDEVELVIASVQRITNEFFRPRQDTIAKEDSLITSQGNAVSFCQTSSSSLLCREP